jgi:hypothetical protein
MPIKIDSYAVGAAEVIGSVYVISFFTTRNVKTLHFRIRPIGEKL